MRLDIQDASYMEVSNIGDSVINLADVWFMNMRWAYGAHQPEIIFNEQNEIDTIRWPQMMEQPTFISKGPDQVLNPGESFVLSMVMDRGWGPDNDEIRHNPCVFKKSNWHIHQTDHNDESVAETNFPEYKNYPFDSISPHRNLLWTGYSSSMVLMHVYYNSDGTVKDSVTVDLVNLVLDENADKVEETVPVAGIGNAVETHILVRKSSVTEGNLDWNDSRGVSPEDSEWITIPNFHEDGLCYNTIGNHGNFTLNPQSDLLNIDFENGVITVPWGTQKGDSIIKLIQTGEGVAWQYHENTEDLKHAHTISQDGDTLIMWACGDVVETKEFQIQVSAPVSNMALVFPRKIQTDTTSEGFSVYGSTPYFVTEDDPEMDTILDVPFATRVDTLFKYLEKAPEATWEIVWIDGEERVDLKNGDVLKVTAQDGSTSKEYYIKVDPYAKADNVDLGAITWPDRPDFLDPLVWNAEDTIPAFDPKKLLYRITLPLTSKTVPALMASPVSLNATVEIDPAENLTGSLEQRTTNIHVTSESDTITKTYQVIFERDLPNELKQPFISEPIISEILGRQRWNAALEIANPGTEPLDLSGYMVVISKTTGITPAQAIQDIIPNLEGGEYANRYMDGRCYIPGYKWPETLELYDANPGIMEFDPNVDPIVEPKDVFVIGNSDFRNGKEEPWVYEETDVVLSKRYNTWDEENLHNKSMINFPSGVDNIFLFKISNDSILLGQKVIGDPADFELIEFWGTINEDNEYHIGGRTFGNTDRVSFRRKPHYVTPGTGYEHGWAGTEEESDWYANQIGDEFQGINLNFANISFDIGNHTMDPSTIYMSTVSSILYQVDDGYEGELFIEGVSWGETVNGFYTNLIKADTGQDLTVLSNADGSEKATDAAVENNDTLRVISADSTNMTKYIISTAALDDDAVLTPADGSGIEINISDTTGVISGFGYDMTLKTLLENIEQPPLAQLYILNSSDELVPLHTLNNDTVKVEKTVSDSYYFKVVAQNNVTAITYDLQPELGDNQAYITSDVYSVDQELLVISLVGQGIAYQAFMDNIIIPEGVKVTLYDKAGFERTEGTVKFDDVLFVESEDGAQTKTYFLQFFEEAEGTDAYVLSDVLNVDQDALIIMGVTEGTTVSEFIQVLTPAPEATMQIVDEDGNEVTSGDVMDTYMVKVVSGDGNLIVDYDIEVLVSVGNHSFDKLKVYPNPVNNILHIDNLPTNSQVSLKNIYGQTIKVVNSIDVHSGLDVSGLSDGVYLIVVEKDNQVTGITKFVKSR
ncbi:MAG: T9SS type A sorting domain-containing protein [bacterium]